MGGRGVDYGGERCANRLNNRMLNWHLRQFDWASKREMPGERQLAEVTVHYLIYSFNQKAWWRANGAGYTKKRSEAGVYSVEEAERQCFAGTDHGNTPKGDVMVRAGGDD